MPSAAIFSKSERKRSFVGVERLYARMELRAREAQLLHRTLDLGDGAVALVRIDAGEAHELPWVALDDLGHGVVAQRLAAGGRLGVPGEQDADNILLVGRRRRSRRCRAASPRLWK